MKTKIDYNINLLGLMLVIIGGVIFIFAFAIEATKSNSIPYNLWNELFTIGEISMPLSVVLIFGGIVLFSLDIIPSTKEKVPLETLKIRYVLGEISKQQYELMMRDSESSRKIIS